MRIIALRYPFGATLLPNALTIHERILISEPYSCRWASYKRPSTNPSRHCNSSPTISRLRTTSGTLCPKWAGCRKQLCITRKLCGSFLMTPRKRCITTSGMALWRAGQLQGAIDHLERAVQSVPDFTEAHVNAGDCPVANPAAIRRPSRNSRRHYDSVPILPRCTAVWDWLCSKPVKCRMRSTTSSKPCESNPITLKRISIWGWHTGKNEPHAPEAIEQYEQALKLRPDFVPATQALARPGKLAIRRPAARAVRLACSFCVLVSPKSCRDLPTRKIDSARQTALRQFGIFTTIRIGER